MVDGVSVIVPPQVVIRNYLSVAALRAADSDNNVDGDPALIRDLDGFFFWDSTSTATDDGVNVIKPADKTPLQEGRWLSQGAVILSSVNPFVPTLAALKAASITKGAVLYDGSVFTWTLDDFTGQADDINIIKSDSTPLSVGAWVRQGADSIQVPPIPAAVGMKILPMLEYVRDIPLNAEMFGAVGNAVADDTTPMKNLIAYAQSSKREIILKGAKKYRCTDTVGIRDEIRMHGAFSSDEGTVLINDISDPSKYLLDIRTEVGESVIGLEIGHLHITTKQVDGVYQQGNRAIKWSTDPFYANLKSRLHHVLIYNHRYGLAVGGRTYQSLFEDLLISSNDLALGPIMGVETVEFDDITYNTFNRIEVTNVINGGMAFNVSSPNSNFDQLTMDGPCLFNCPSGTIRNVTCENMTQTAGFPQVMVMNFTNFSEVVAPKIVNVPNSKFGIGIFIGGDGCLVVDPRFLGAQPNSPIYPGGGKFIIVGGGSEAPVVNKIPVSGEGGLNGTVALNCPFTDFNLEAPLFATWTPTFSTWDTPPALNAARYIKTGNMITVVVNANDGVIGAGDSIGGLPFTANAAVGGTALIAANDGTKNVSGKIGNGGSVISGLPAKDLTGEFWQLTATYLI